MRLLAIMTIATLTGCSMRSFVTPAAYVWGSSSSTTQTGFTADGGNGFVYPQSNTSSMFYGDMA
jgi:hypothetical protein